jgi:hypothetical protein
MAYTKFAERIATAIEANFKLISARYNFDLGDEFEIALCELLVLILPEQYGVCRGFVVTSDDQCAGDDIIIYDKHKFPRLRLIGENEFSKKEEIPVESVYAYIEAKHTLVLADSDHPQSLIKAMTQVSDVKKLPREKRSLLHIDPYINLGNVLAKPEVKDRPDFFNPLYGCIISRHVKVYSKSEAIDTNHLEIDRVFSDVIPKISEQIISSDIIVLADSMIAIPGIQDKETINLTGAFYIEDKSGYVVVRTKISALSVAIICLMRALDQIKLFKMPWAEMVRAQLDIPSNMFEK